MDLSTWIERWAAFAPDRSAIICDGEALSYAALDAMIGRMAGGLRARAGVGRGDRVAFLGANCPEMIALTFACARLGAMVVPLNWRLAPPEHGYILDHCGAGVLVCEPDFMAVGEAVAESVAGSVADLRLLSTAPDGGLFADTPDTTRTLHVDGATPLLVVYTSGTTGKPKGAVLSQDALLWNAVNSTHMHDLTSADRVLTTAPLFHVGGLNIQTLPALHAGATILLHRRFDAGAVLAAIAADAPTLAVLVPTQIQAMVDQPNWTKTNLASLRMVTTGSTIVPLAVIDAFHARDIPVVQVYGSTETAPIAAYLRADQARDHVGSTGLPALHCDLRIVDEDGAPVEAGGRGEIQVRGPNVMVEYWADAPATEAAFADGWFKSGDIGHLDENGFLFVDDRLKDVIISGGENIYSAELEVVLDQDPRITEAAVIGRAEERWGEVPVAIVVAADPALDAGAVLALFENRLARFKHPKDVIFCQSLPRNAMGKIEKFTLREKYGA
ncbi:MAG: AMP-binding protein [Alphaproteobacteria bacterium]